MTQTENRPSVDTVLAWRLSCLPAAIVEYSSKEGLGSFVSYLPLGDICLLIVHCICRCTVAYRTVDDPRSYSVQVV